MWLQVIPYFINHFFLNVASSFGNRKNDFSAQLCLLYIALVLTAEITACITSLLSTCRHFADKQPAECKGRNSLLILEKNLQLRHLTKYGIFAETNSTKNVYENLQRSQLIINKSFDV